MLAQISAEAYAVTQLRFPPIFGVHALTIERS